MSDDGDFPAWVFAIIGLALLPGVVGAIWLVAWLIQTMPGGGC